MGGARGEEGAGSEKERKRRMVNANASILVKIANSGSELIMEQPSERASERTTSKIIENRAAGAGLRNPGENKNRENVRGRNIQRWDMGSSCK